MHRLVSILLAGALVSSLGGCSSGDHGPKFTEAISLAGQDQPVSAERLNHGREAYILNCYACHGPIGQGDGPAAPGLRPPPRDFTQATFKFGWVVDGLPHDEDLVRIVRGGLHGTAMLKWDVRDHDLDAILQYIKTFAPDYWTDPDGLGEQVVPTPDPWKGRTQQAIARGKKVYHGFATCQQCHPSYATEREVVEASKEWSKDPSARDNPHYAELKGSEYRVGDHAVRIMPPDFTFNPMRVSHEVEDVYRTIGAGIPGTAMPAWKGSLPEDDLWALSHYVKSLIDLRDTAEAVRLRQRLSASSM